MNISWKFDQTDINWHDLVELYTRAPLGNKTVEGVEISFSNSMFKCFAYFNDQLIGTGRALADGVDCSYLCDIAIDPSYQGLGIGKQLVQHLIKLSQKHNKIILYANKGMEGFYEKLGFKRMNTAMALFQDEPTAIKNGFINP